MCFQGLQALYRWCRGLFLPHKMLSERPLAVPVGSFEDHGGRPVVLDTLLALSVACLAHQRCGVGVAWPIGYGYSPLHRWWAGLGPGELGGLLEQLLGSLARLARGVVVVDGHYGHRALVGQVARRHGGYVNVWEVLAEEGLAEWEEQLGFEKDYWRCIAAGEGCRRVEEQLGNVAERVCSVTGTPQGGDGAADGSPAGSQAHMQSQPRGNL